MVTVVVRALAAAAVAMCLGHAVTAQARGGDAGARDLAAALQKYNGIRDFSADFVHSYKGGVLKKTVTERGRMIVKRPGKMRWQYTSPEEKLFVSDGIKVYSYIPQDKQVMVSSVPPDDRAASPTLFLAGKGSLTRDFTSTTVPPPTGLPAGTRALKLVPTSAQRDYEWLILAVGSDTLDLRALVTVDAQGGESTFSFTNLKENTGITDKAFAFAIPRGVDVITDSPSR